MLNKTITTCTMLSNTTLTYKHWHVSRFGYKKNETYVRLLNNKKKWK